MPYLETVFPLQSLLRTCICKTNKNNELKPQIQWVRHCLPAPLKLYLFGSLPFQTSYHGISLLAEGFFFSSKANTSRFKVSSSLSESVLCYVNRCKQLFFFLLQIFCSRLTSGVKQTIQTQGIEQPTFFLCVC